MIKSALMLDLNNLYFSIQSKFGRNHKLIVEKYVQHLESFGHTFTYKIAYSTQTSDDAHKLFCLLKTLGFETYFGPENWSISMALRLSDICPNVDSFVLGSANSELWRLLSYAREKGKIVKCCASNIPGFFKQYAACIEVGDGVLKKTENLIETTG